MIRGDMNTPGAARSQENKDGQPLGLVNYSYSWSLRATHECLKMLADPFGKRLVTGISTNKGQARIEFLVEVCDPSEATEFDYEINGLQVSDFYTPAFFNPVANPGTRYSFTGAITKPRQVLKGGYLSWRHPPTNSWFQQTFFSGTKPIIKSLGVLSGTGSLRSQIDALTPTDIVIPPANVSGKSKAFLTASGSGSAGVELIRDFTNAIEARESQLNDEIAAIKKKYQP